MQDLTVQEALARVLALFEVLPMEYVPLVDALGRILAEDLFAHDSLPPFANSAMDGYALRAQDTANAVVRLQVVGEVAAGQDPVGIVVNAGEAVRIMTGASLPAGVDAVIPVEDTDEAWQEAERPLPSHITIQRLLQSGDYVRQVGEDIEAGQQVLSKGHLIRPQEIGVLASLGVSQVPVVRRPRVGILATGDELVGVDEPLTAGKIRNSNEYTQMAQVVALGGVPVPLGVAKDTEADVRAKLKNGVEAGVDLFVSSAGVSVGVYDVVTAVLQAEGNIDFWRVRMRPGKPLAFGTYQGIPYLGLPGNPVSAMVSFERFARPALRKMSGHSTLNRSEIIVTTEEDIGSDGRESYLRAIVRPTPTGYVGTTTGGQGSHMMTSLVRANALLIIPEGVKSITSGDQVSAWLLD